VKRLVFLALLSGCSPAPEEPPPRQDPVVVYAAFEDDAAIVEMFDRYKKETGVLVIVRRGPAERIVSDLVRNDVTPPADLLMTRSVVDAWLAAEESALRPLYSESVAEKIPAWARDPDDLWFATGVDRAVVVYHGDTPFAPELADLGHDRFSGGLCLSSSANAVNRTAIAMHIDLGDVRTTELMVRRWVSNLALPPFKTESDLLEAIADGRCKIGLASQSAAIATDVPFLEPAYLVADVHAIGVARHARNPDGAAALLEWLVSHSRWDSRALPDDRNVGLLAWHYEDAIKLAERARYP